MSNYRYCRRCGNRFDYKRDDKQFCSPACVAAWYRENPNPEYIHAANMDEFWHECEYCHVSYYVNGYAERGGKRAPKYCSVKHKQAAYRQRQKETQDQAARRSTADNGAAPKQSSRKQAPPPPPPPPPPPKSTKRGGLDGFKHVGARRQSPASVSEALRILGLSSLVSKAELRRAYLNMVGKWHPDRNTDPAATEWTQAINWAYDHLKT